MYIVISVVINEFRWTVDFSYHTNITTIGKFGRDEFGKSRVIPQTKLFHLRFFASLTLY